MRQFDTGANRNDDSEKLDYEGFINPLVVHAFSQYMQKHRYLEDGTLRASDNWQHGIPRDSLMKSGFRHFMDWWLEHRGYESREGTIDALCGLLFNANAYLLSILEEEQENTKETNAVTVDGTANSIYATGTGSGYGVLSSAEPQHYLLKDPIPEDKPTISKFPDWFQKLRK